MTCLFFFFQAEDGIRDYKVTGVQTCALPISQRGVHEVGPGMIALDIPAPRLVHLRRRRGRLERRTEGTDYRAPALDLLDIRDLELPPLPLHPSRVADLATRLRVERILLEHQLQRVARLAEGEEIGVGARRVVADPLLPALRLHH